MPRWRACTEDAPAPDAGVDDGSTSLEFITAGLLLLVPLVYLILTLSALQGASFAVEGASRQAARVFVDGASESVARADAAAAVDVALADYGLDAATVSIRCSPDPDDCLARRALVTVTVSTRVALPLVPTVLEIHVPAAIPVTASATAQVSRFSGEQR